MRTVLELQGIDCLGLEDYAPKKSILCAKSFGEMQTELPALSQALCRYVARVVEKMRSQSSKACRVQIFLMSNRFRKDLKQYANSIEYQFVHPTDDVRIITKVAKQALKKIYRTGILYKKVGFAVLEMMDKSQVQQDLFNPLDEDKTMHADKLMDAMDAINKKFGKSSIHLAATGFKAPWKMRANLCSPAYTTRWDELPLVRA